MDDPLEFFAKHYQPHAREIWSETSLRGMAAVHAPDALFGKNWSIVRGDALVMWARWFVASLINPSQFTNPEPGQYVKLYRSVNNLIDKRYVHSTASQRESLVEVLVQLVNTEIQRRKRTRRNSYDSVTKRELVDRAGSPARCWICGHQFATVVVDRFLDDSCTSRIALPEFIDFLRPAGFTESDLSIQVDHVTPVSGGGDNDDNLRLACGWCNRTKSNHTNLYDVGSNTYRFKHPKLGVLDLPQPFWVVRVLAITKECQHHDAPACKATTQNAQLYIAPLQEGAMTPPNLSCFCANHDPWRNHRFILKSEYENGMLKKAISQQTSF